MADLISTASTTAIAEQLAGRIRAAHHAASTAAQTALGHALEAGRLLAEAREAVPHGGWGDYVASCGIADRTASSYMRLYRERDRLGDRQRVADLSVRQATRLLAEPKAKAEAPPVVEGSIMGEAPAWYRPGHRHAGTHPSGACFMVWPHPAGEPWVHVFVVIPHDPASPDSGGLLEGPKRGIRVDRLSWLFDFKRGGGLPDMRDPSWVIGDPKAMTPEEIAAEPDFNTWLFRDEDDYRRRGMGIMSAMTPAMRDRAGEAHARACMSLAKAIPGKAERRLFDEDRAVGTASLVPLPSSTGTKAAATVEGSIIGEVPTKAKAEGKQPRFRSVSCRQKVMSLLITVRRKVESIDAGTGDRSSVRRDVAIELRRLANTLCPVRDDTEAGA